MKDDYEPIMKGGDTQGDDPSDPPVQNDKPDKDKD